METKLTKAFKDASFVDMDAEAILKMGKAELETAILTICGHRFAVQQLHNKVFEAYKYDKATFEGKSEALNKLDDMYCEILSQLRRIYQETK